MNFRSDTVLSEIPNFMNFRLLSVNTTYELWFIFVPTTIVGRLMDGSNWLLPGHDINEATADGVSKTKAKNNYNFKSEFETRREKIVNEYFGRQNDPMSRPTLDSTPLGKNMTKGKTSPIDSSPVGTKTPESMPLTRPTELSEQNGKAHVPGDPDPYPSS